MRPSRKAFEERGDYAEIAADFEFHASAAGTASPSPWEPARRKALSAQLVSGVVGIASIVSAGCLDPGSIQADLQTAIHFGPATWPYVWSFLVAIAVHMLTIHTAVAAKMDLASMIRQRYGRRPRLMAALCGIAMLMVVVSSVQEMVGTAMALHLLLGVPTWSGILMCFLNSFTLLLLEHWGIRALSHLMMIFLAILLMAAIELLRLSLQSAATDTAFSTAHILTDMVVPFSHGPHWLDLVANFGSMLMTHNIFLQSALAAQLACCQHTPNARDFPQLSALSPSTPRRRSSRGQWVARLTVWDMVAMLLTAVVVNVLLVLALSAAFPTSSTLCPLGLEDVTFRCEDLGMMEVGRALRWRVGAAAETWWTVLLLVSGTASSITAVMAGQGILEGFLSLDVPMWKSAALTRFAALVPAVAVATLATSTGPSTGIPLDELISDINLLQVVSLPFVLVPLVLLATTPGGLEHDGDFLLSPPLKVAAYVGVVISVLLALLTGIASLVNRLMSIGAGPAASYGTSALVGGAYVVIIGHFCRCLMQPPDGDSCRVPGGFDAPYIPLAEDSDREGEHKPPPQLIVRTACNLVASTSSPRDSPGTSGSGDGSLHSLVLSPGPRDPEIVEEVPGTPHVPEPFAFGCALKLFAATAGLLMGYNIGVISGALSQIGEYFSLSTFQKELCVSIIVMGALVGSPIGGWSMDILGRRFTVLFAASVYWQGCLIQGFASSFTMLLIGGFAVGIGVGVGVLAVPMYVGELAPSDRRGALVAINELAISIGILFAFVIDATFSGMPEGWRYMLGLATVPSFLQFCIAAVFPESPWWLLSRSNPAGAVAVLLDIRVRALWLASGDARGLPEAAWTPLLLQELGLMQATLRSQTTHHAGNSLRDLLQPELRRPLIVATGLCFFQQMTGQPTLLSYAASIFQLAGFSTSSAGIASMSLGLAKLAGTLITVCNVDKFGRRPFLIVGQAGMLVGLLILLVVFLLLDYSTVHSPLVAALACVGLVIFTGCYSFGYGPITWVVVSEIFPMHIRGRAGSICNTINWACNIVMSLTFLSTVDTLGRSATFLGYTLLGVVALLFIFQVVPETKPKAVAEGHTALVCNFD
ncbi:Vacuolar glucose transporter 1 [Cymbomonas tetramitiformis]|uniref:Vacuolar glucose transporter 1 n=1 Tax=Cymbomonas tetramitiformis TaxID=36881 RepID=A0AAE0FX62_9CHLO|nr:Vacuolar glucose transporter 1 [Cymbomonas tetramitiformis]